jgi:predicted CXXCH cytochrome family protein
MKKTIKYYKWTFSAILWALLLFFTLSMNPSPEKNEITILYTGELKGYIDPVGCTQESLGGIEQRDSLLQSLKTSNDSFLIIDNGDIVTNLTRQDELKAEVVISEMSLVNYQAMNLGEGDLLLGSYYIRYLSSIAGFPFLSANASFQNIRFEPYKIVSRKFGDKEVKIAIIGIISKKFEENIRSLYSSFSILEPKEVLSSLVPILREKADFVFLLAHTDLDEAKKLAKEIPSVDVMFIGHGNDSLDEYPIQVGETTIVSSGNKGKYVIKLAFSVSENKRLIKRDYQIIPVMPNLQPWVSIQTLMIKYRQAIKNENLLLRSAEIKRFPKGGNFVGSPTCKKCHDQEAMVWELSKHHNAFSFLDKKGRDCDPECAQCHTTGYTYIGGFVNSERTPELKGVGCESCHGAGSIHVSDVKRSYREVGEAACLGCHTKETSPNFSYQENWTKIKH